MTPLLNYIQEHTARGECRCGQCADALIGPEQKPPDHSVDVYYFRVSARGEPTAQALRELLRAYPYQDRLEGGPSYIEMGSALGDQELALRLIALGQLVGLWRAITPKDLGFDGDEAKLLAGNGLVMCSGLKKQESERANKGTEHTRNAG